jgi:phosphoribosyl 1,2-cyclic phosphodiesterase
MPSERKTSSKLEVNLVPVPDQELETPAAVSQVPHEIARHLGDESTGRMVGDPEDVHLTSRQFEDEEHVELLE